MSQPDYENDLVFPPQQPTINTFEELAVKNGIDFDYSNCSEDNCFFEIQLNNGYITYFKKGQFAINGTIIGEVDASKADLVITALKDNLGG